MIQRTNARAAALALLLATAAPAPGDAVGSVDLQVRGKTQVGGTVRPAFDRECFVCDLPAGAVLGAKLKGFGLAATSFDLGLLLDADPVPGVAPVRKGATVGFSGFAVPASGRYRVVVTSEIDGDYDLRLAWKSQSKFAGTGGPVAPAASDTFTFSAPAGASATIDIRPAKGSAFVTEILTVTGPGGYDSGPTPGTRASLVPFSAGGDYTAVFRNAGAAAGGWTASVKLKLPKVAATKIDIRDGSTTGAFADSHTVFGRVLGPDGGTLDLPSNPGPLNGSSISLPAGVLGGPVVITIGVAAPVTPDDGTHGAGPAVEFGPTGTVFDPSGSDVAKQATLTIPFDPGEFPSGTDLLVVYVRDADGKVAAVPRPYTFNGNTVSFTTSHLSAYQAASGGPRRFAGDFAVVQIEGEQQFNFGGRFGFALESLSGAGSSAGLDTNEARITWAFEGGMGASSFLSVQNTFQSLDVTVVNDSRVTLQNSQQSDPPVTFRRGPGGDAFVARDAAILLLRRAAGQPTVATIAGRWHVFHLGFGTQQEGPSQPAPLFLELAGDAGSLTLAADGTLTFGALRSAETNTEFPTGVWTTQSGNGPPPGMTWSVEEGGVTLRSPGESQPIPLEPVLGGDVLVGMPYSFGGQFDSGPSTELFVLVRASSGAKLSEIAGDYEVIGHETETLDRTPIGQGMRFVVSTLRASISGNGTVTTQGSTLAAEHDTQGAPATESGEIPLGPAGRIVLKPDGSFTGADGVSGAFTPRGDLFVRTQFDGSRFAIDFGVRAAGPTTKVRK